MGILDGIENLDAPEGGQYLPVGAGKIRINQMLEKAKDDGAKFFVCENTLLEVHYGCEGVAPGADTAYYREFKFPDRTKREIAGLYFAAFGNKLGRKVGKGDLSREDANAVTSEAQPLAGAEVYFYAWQKPGKKYTHYKFRAVGVEDPFGIDGDD